MNQGDANRERTGSKTRRRGVLFFVTFVLLFLAFQWGYVAWRTRSANALSHTLNAVVASRLINLATPGEATVADGTVIRSRSVDLEIMKGCEGFEVTLLLAAAILAFPRPWKSRVLGLLGGAALFYLLNLVRIISLYYVLRYAPAFFSFMHLLFWQSLFVLLVAAYFLFWATRLSVRRSGASATPPKGR